MPIHFAVREENLEATDVLWDAHSIGLGDCLTFKPTLSVTVWK